MMIELIMKNIKGENEKKQFTIGRKSGLIVRQAMEIYETVNLNRPSTEELDKMVDFLVYAYDKQFTRDDVYEGMDWDTFIPTILEQITNICSTLRKISKEQEVDGSEKK